MKKQQPQPILNGKNTKKIVDKMKQIFTLLIAMIMTGCVQNSSHVSKQDQATPVETNDEPQFAPCDNFIQIGKKYKFDSLNFKDKYESIVTFSQESMFVNTAIFVKECKIIHASYYKNTTNQGYYYADLDIIFDEEECEARFSIGPTSRGLTIYYPKPSHDIHYVLDYTH
jgi:hypothetical protein